MARTALVTGSAQGIGHAIAVALADAGCTVVGADIKAQASTEFETAMVDLASPGACRDLVRDVGRIDVLVNNAAVLVEKPVDEMSDEEFEWTMAVNVHAPFVLATATAGRMVAEGWGRIINVSSVAARTGGVSQSCVYAASKAGLIAMTKNFARNYGPRGITSNAVLPGGIATPMALGQFEKDPALRDRLVAQIPVGHLGTAEEVAAVVSFLASSHASFVNGASIDVNGGWVMT